MYFRSERGAKLSASLITTDKCLFLACTAAAESAFLCAGNTHTYVNYDKLHLFHYAQAAGRQHT